MSSIIVDIASMAVSSNPDDTLITYSLGSCLGITVYDPVVRVGGMIHCMLPLSSSDPQKAQTKPCMFVDSGMVELLKKLFDMGVRKNSAIVMVAGGSQVLDKQGLFRIGERNYTVFRKILWKNGMMIKSEEVGGSVSRTMKLDIATGNVFLRSEGREWQL